MTYIKVDFFCYLLLALSEYFLLYRLNHIIKGKEQQRAKIMNFHKKNLTIKNQTCERIFITSGLSIFASIFEETPKIKSPVIVAFCKLHLK